MNSINIPRYCNGNLVYDEIPMNSIITTSTLTSGYSYIDSNNDGILVKNNNDISFKTFDGILYYKNNELTDCVLSGNTLIYTNVESTLSQINISGGVLNTYKFDDNSVDTSNADPSFTDKLVLNNCEIVDESNQRINKNYLIYGNCIEHGLSPIELDTPSNNYEYYYIVNDSNKAINVSTSSQIYTDLYNTVQESIIPRISAIPICNSTDNQHLSLSLIIPQHYNNGNYYIKSDGSYFSLETIYGSILPSSLKTSTKDFNYSNNKILTIGKNNSNEDVFIPIQSSTSLKKPYLSGTGWGDLTYTTFLNSNNLSITKSLIYSNPVVIGTNGSMYGVILPENKKYVLTKSSFKELSITGNDLYINNYPSLNLHKIIQVDNDILSTLSDTTNTEIGLLHTKDTGEISISKLTNEDISNNAITTDKIAPGAVGETQIANNSITSSKLNINDSNLSGTWKNLLIDNNNNFVTTGALVTHYGVFNKIGGVQDLNSAVLNEIGLNLYIPDGEENEFNQTFVSANCRFYTNDIIYKYVNTNYIKVYNYFNSNNSSNKIIYVNNSNQITDSYGNISNTYTLFSDISDKNNNKYNIKLKVSLNIKDVRIDLTNTNNSNFSYINLDNTLLKSGTILIVGVYTSLCKLNDPSQVLVLPNKIFRYTDNTNYCKSTLLGYLPILVNTIENEKINNINIDKIFDFECTVDKNNFFLDDFENIKNDLLFFVPMFYINIYDNTNSIIGLNYADYVVKDEDNKNTNVSTFYTNMCLNNDNSFTITYNKSNDSNTKTIISSSDISVNNDEITIKNYNNYNIKFTDNNIFYVGTNSNYKNFMHLQNMKRDKIVTIDNINHKMTFKYFLNEPIEKNININLSPITNQSNIIYTTKDTGTNELKNTITYKFSLCSINLSLTKNTGEYPTQFKMS